MLIYIVVKVYDNIALVLNGKFPSSEILVKKILSSDFIIAVDGAANELKKFNIQPNVVIGDFDSINDKIDESTKYINKPDQSKTDFRKSLEWLVAQKFSKVNIFGISGKNDDHFLGNIYTFNEFSHLIKLQAFTDSSVITPLFEKREFKSHKDQKVSLFVLNDSAIINSTNLEYRLDNFELFPSDSAIRNISKGSTFTLQSTSKLLVFQSIN
jgi:thiamine pyrophosphokinase